MERERTSLNAPAARCGRCARAIRTFTRPLRAVGDGARSLRGTSRNLAEAPYFAFTLP
jgi:hypothetical protein